MAISQDLTRPRTVPRKKVSLSDPEAVSPPYKGLSLFQGAVEKRESERTGLFVFAQTSSATQMIAISDSCECLRCSRCRCREFVRETDGRTRIQPVYNASSTGASRPSRSLSFFLSLLLSFSPLPSQRELSRLATSTASTPAVPYAFPPLSANQERRRRRRRASCIHLNQYARRTRERRGTGEREREREREGRKEGG